MIFAELAPAYLNSNDRAILSRMETFYANSISVYQSWMNESDLDSRFWAGDQSAWESFYGPIPNTRRQFVFNHMRATLNTPSGYQRQHRKSMIATPVENGDQKTADQYTKVMRYITNKENVLETISEAFEGSLVTGMNFLYLWNDFRSDPLSGDIKIDRIPYNRILFDPFMTKPDMSDCNAVWMRRYVTRREAISLLPEQAEEIAGLFGKGIIGSRDGKFPFMPENFSANRGAENLLAYDMFWYKDYRTAQMLVDSQTGECTEWTAKDNGDGLQRFLATYPQITVIDQEVPTVRCAIVINGKCFYDGPSIDGCDTMPFVPVYSYWNPEIPYYNIRLSSLARMLRDPQYLFNRFMVIISDIFESQITSGGMFHPDDVIDPTSVYNGGQGKWVGVKKGVPLETAVQRWSASDVPQGMFQHLANFAKEFNMITGVSEELQGAATDDVAGILSRLRQGASLINMQGIFDKLDLSVKILGERMLERIQTNYTPGKVQMILEGEQPEAQFYNKAFGKYHVMVSEGINTTTQRQQQLAEMLELKKVGVPIPDNKLLEACTFQNKDEIIKAMQEQAQQTQQAQQAQQQLELQEVKSRINFTEASAQAQQSMGLERVSRIQENKQLAEERKAAAIKDEAAAFLDYLKATKELESVDISHVRELLELGQLVKNHEMMVKEKTMARDQEQQQPKEAAYENQETI